MIGIRFTAHATDRFSLLPQWMPSSRALSPIKVEGMEPWLWLGVTNADADDRATEARRNWRTLDVVLIVYMWCAFWCDDDVKGESSLQQWRRWRWVEHYLHQLYSRASRQPSSCLIPGRLLRDEWRRRLTIYYATWNFWEFLFFFNTSILRERAVSCKCLAVQYRVI